MADGEKKGFDLPPWQRDVWERLKGIDKTELSKAWTFPPYLAYSLFQQGRNIMGGRPTGFEGEEYMEPSGLPGVSVDVQGNYIDLATGAVISRADFEARWAEWQAGLQKEQEDQRANELMKMAEFLNDPTRMTEFERATLGLRERELAAGQRGTQGISPLQQQQLELEKRGLALQEAEAAARLAGMGNRGWVTQWFQNQMNQLPTWTPPIPWRDLPMERMTPTQRGARVELGRKGLDPFSRLSEPLEERALLGFGDLPKQELAGRLGVPLKDVDKYIEIANQYNIPTSTPEMFPISPVTGKQAWEIEHGGGGYGGINLPPESPKTPKDLPFLGQMVQLGERIHQKKSGVKTPSGQLWAGIPSAQRQKFAGMMDFWRGEDYQDMLDKMAMMAPRTPRRGQPSWRPQKQRV